MTAYVALALALALLPGVAFIAARVAFTTWRQERRRQARGAWRMIDNVRGMTAPHGEVCRDN